MPSNSQSTLLCHYALFVLLLCSCIDGDEIKKEIVISDADTSVNVFSLPSPPAVLDDLTQIADFYRHHYWDNFDVYDTAAILVADTALMINAFVQYVNLLQKTDPTDATPVEELMRRVSVTRASLDWFSMMANVILADHNSPYRNDEFYIPVIEARLASPYYDNASQVRDRHTLGIAMQNRIGRKANDIIYTMIDGCQGRLYDIDAPYVLVYINNPGCEMCRSVCRDICNSRLITSLIAQNVVRVLAICPDEELDEWREYSSEIPPEWINGYDKGCLMRTTGSYNLSAIPSIYLLDKDKKVLVKDGTDVAEIERILCEESIIGNTLLIK